MGKYVNLIKVYKNEKPENKISFNNDNKMEKEIKKLRKKFLGKKILLNRLYYGAMDILKMNIFTDSRYIDRNEEQIIFYKEDVKIIIKYKTIEKHFTGETIEVLDIYEGR